MKIVALSDTHFTNEDLWKLKVPEGDVLIHAGDATFAGKPSEWEPFIRWWKSHPHVEKRFLPGNHDFNWPFPKWDVHEYMGYNFGMMPLVPNLIKWANYGTEEEIRAALKEIGKVDVLITHSPPQGILDMGHSHFGSYALRNFIDSPYAPSILICGHIHECHGYMKYKKTHCYNVAICDRNYNLTQPCTEIELEEVLSL